MEIINEPVRLTQFSHAAGCGCKIAPKVLEEILQSDHVFTSENLIVGNKTRDDAAVYDLGNGTGLISTTDFFMPIVDDASDFGKIAAANAISDVYAMGGKPVLALAILGWPVNKLPAELAREVLDGGRWICDEAGIPLAGGHSIDSPEPVFGLAVNGLVDLANLKRNDNAKEGDLLFLTKSLGTGIISTAQKRGLLKEEHSSAWLNQLKQLNKIGEELGKIKGVSSMTDITGFGLLGHLIEMTSGSRLSALIDYNAINKLPGVIWYVQQRIVPDSTFRNWNSYSDKVKFEKNVNTSEAFNILPDPQTNGGLLIAVKEEEVEKVQQLIQKFCGNEFTKPIGRMIASGDKAVYVDAIIA